MTLRSDHPQRRLGAGPGHAEHLDASAARQQAQGERQQDRIVGDADDRKEVRDQVDRQRQVCEHEPQSHAPRQGDAAVAGEAPDQHQAIGDEARDGAGVLARIAARARWRSAAPSTGPSTGNRLLTTHATTTPATNPPRWAP